MAKWMDAHACVPKNQEMVEVAHYVSDNNPPFWKLSHAWYCLDCKIPEWVRKGGEDWPIDFWRESVQALMDEKPWE